MIRPVIAAALNQRGSANPTRTGDHGRVGQARRAAVEALYGTDGDVGLAPADDLRQPPSRSSALMAVMTQPPGACSLRLSLYAG